MEQPGRAGAWCVGPSPGGWRRWPTTLTSYTHRAHGFVFFLAQVGEGLNQPPRLVKADELDVQVYWRAPNRSKQVILGWRDGTWLPTDINYHRDHLGIVTNNFGNRIRHRRRATRCGT